MDIRIVADEVVTVHGAKGEPCVNCGIALSKAEYVQWATDKDLVFVCTFCDSAMALGRA